jgi:hypothetical protein
VFVTIPGLQRTARARDALRPGNVYVSREQNRFSECKRQRNNPEVFPA